MTSKKNWLEAVFDCDGLQEILVNLLEHAVDHATSDQSIKYASPIEFAMATALCVVRKVNYPEFGFHARPNLTKNAATDIFRNTQAAGSPDRPLGCIFPQVEIGEHRVDFLVVHNGGGLVVECDGHDFHEKTKEQAAKDKARDRALQEYDLKVFHYTGSEIWRDPVKCAREVLTQAHTDAADAENNRIDIRSEGQFAAVVNALRAPF